MTILRNKEQVKIIKETGEYLLVYKPAGLAVQSRSLTEPDLESVLKNGDKSRSYLAVINRLDQAVEGLVLFGKTKKAAAALSNQLNRHMISKIYMAVVDGVPDRNSGQLKDHLLKNGRTNMSQAVPEGTEGAKEAILEYQVISAGEDSALLKIRLYTGRHHQIRVQLSNAGIPIAGDRKYNSKTSPYPFPALCSCELKFRDPETGKYVECKITPKGKAFGRYAELFNR